MTKGGAIREGEIQARGSPNSAYKLPPWPWLPPKPQGAGRLYATWLGLRYETEISEAAHHTGEGVFSLSLDLFYK